MPTSSRRELDHHQNSYFDNGVTVFNNRLYIGTLNIANGGEVWQYVGYPAHLPAVLRNTP